MHTPSNKQELESYLGLVNYLKRHSYQLTHLTKPFNDLMQKNAIFSWESSQDEAFQAIKKVITSAPVLEFYDVQANHVIQTDASNKGFGAVLLQNDKPVIFAGRGLLPAEHNYSTIEKELAAIVFALRRMHHFIHGGKVLVQTDHKPLVAMFNRQVHLSSMRQQRLLLKLYEYDVQMEYLKGKNNVIADALSRLTASTEQIVEPDTVIPVHTITSTINASESRLERLRKATASDSIMNQLSHYIIHGWPTHRHLSDPLTFDYWNYKSEISIEDGIIFKGDKLVIPEAERVSYTKDLHVGHLGEEKTLLRARQLVFWPNLTNDIRAVVSGCTSCQADRPALQREPMIPHEMPARPWEVVGIDFFEWNGSHYLLIADIFSKFPVIRGMTVTTTMKTIAVLKTVFGEYGVPQQIMTDQGPQFTSQEFQEFTNSYEINTKHSSPRYPQSNGFIEAMVKTVKGILIRARDSGTDPQLAMLIYRTTPFKAVPQNS
jgi:hypothetical protein